jgi:hypothetical protein
LVSIFEALNVNFMATTTNQGDTSDTWSAISSNQKDQPLGSRDRAICVEDLQGSAGLNKRKFNLN